MVSKRCSSLPWFGALLLSKSKHLQPFLNWYLFKAPAKMMNAISKTKKKIIRFLSIAVSDGDVFYLQMLTPAIHFQSNVSEEGKTGPDGQGSPGQYASSYLKLGFSLSCTHFEFKVTESKRNLHICFKQLMQLSSIMQPLKFTKIDQNIRRLN